RISNKIGIVIGESLKEINTRAIETELRSIPFVRTVRVYETIDKKLIVELRERKPMTRLIDKKGNTAILDSEGFLMPLSNNTALRLPVITGQFAMSSEFINTNGHVSDSLAHASLADVYTYASAIAAQPFWT